MPDKLNTLRYKIPSEFQKTINPGNYVSVPLKQSFTEGVVLSVSEEKPSYPTKNIKELLVDNPVLQTWQINVARWISEYYKAPLQKSVNLFMPPKFYNREELKISQEKNLKKKFVLTSAQKSAFDKIIKNENKFTLIHGITGSGKTEIYLHLVEKYINEGKQSILIVPEISLTPQTVEYFQRIFGDCVAILHSRLTEKAKSLEWLKIYLKNTPIIIGPRSAVFAPVKNPGLIILDEEHEFSYKQEQTPRYNTSSVIEKISELTGAKVVLGSATPSISTYFKTVEKKIELIELKDRIGNAKLPKISVVDLREEFKKKNYSVLSEILQDKIQSTLNRNKQVILFLNKRGTASAVVCRECGYMEKCRACDVPMTYHKSLPIRNTGEPLLICHHCGYIKKIPPKCLKCNSTAIKYIGTGTQKVEEEARALFPEARIKRVDRDTVSKRGSFDSIYKDFKNKNIDILIGTQMIGKGLHFPGVDLVGIILADIGLHFPDFRSSERTFQILTQVAGRAGRSDNPGEVIIQTYMPENMAIRFAERNDYKKFYEYEIEKRRNFKYPPFSKLIKLTFADQNSKTAFSEAKNIYSKLKEIIKEDDKVYMYPATIFRMNNKYRWHILIQGNNPSIYLEIPGLPENCRIDVDPVSIS